MRQVYIIKTRKKMYSLLVIILLMHVASTTTMQGRSPPSRRRHPLYPAWVSPRHRGPVVVRVDDVFLGSGDGVEVGVDGRRHTSRDVLLRDGG